ncbi:uncharacterized protein LOC123690987 [Colias croceus]|uniref:uncharacterized protein LOC123690987 n=1 Tax=Colias crocea TaxID=72248 RepID=UPI001E27A7FC|nr:uncharacterized protein LOC123690987 [Colias croceus]
MLMLLTVFSAVILFPCNSNTAALRCRLGNHFVCGSDGFTYFNMCDFESVRSIRPNLYIRHEGRCEQNGPTERPKMSKDNGLPKRGYKAKRHHWRKSKGMGILSQILQTQIKLSAFNFEHNTINTQGNNNRFEITINTGCANNDVKRCYVIDH